MAIANFAVPKQLEKKISKTMHEQGITSKAEFFRFAALHFIYSLAKDTCERDEYANAMNNLSCALHERFHGKKFPTLEEQFSDLR